MCRLTKHKKEKEGPIELMEGLLLIRPCHVMWRCGHALMRDPLKRTTRSNVD